MARSIIAGLLWPLFLCAPVEAAQVNPMSNVLGDTEATANTLVYRDSSGQFSAASIQDGTVTSAKLGLAAAGVSVPSAQITRRLDVDTVYSSVAADGIGLGFTAASTITATTDNRGNTAHIVAGLTRCTAAVSSLTDFACFESRVDAYNPSTGSGGVLNEAGFFKINAVSPAAGTSSDNVLRGVRIQVNHSTGADGSGDPVTSATLRGLEIESMVGGDASLRRGIYQSGAADPNYFAGKSGFGVDGPTVELDVRGAATPRIWVVDNTAPVGAEMYADDGTAYIGSYTAHPLAIVVGDAEMLRVTTGGGFRRRVRTLAQIHAITPSVAGEEYLCSNCARAYDVCVATGTAVDQFRVQSGTTGCQ